MKTTIKPKRLAIQSTYDEDSWEIELRYSATLQKQFAKSLQLVKATYEEVGRTSDDIDHEHFEESLLHLGDLAQGQLCQLELEGVSDVIGYLALTLLERKKLHKTLGPLRSAMEALAAIPCVAVPVFKLPPPHKLFSRKGRNWNTYEKLRAAAPGIISTDDARLLFRAIKKVKRSSGDLRYLHTVLTGFVVMYDLALSASRPAKK